MVVVVGKGDGDGKGDGWVVGRGDGGWWERVMVEGGPQRHIQINILSHSRDFVTIDYNPGAAVAAVGHQASGTPLSLQGMQLIKSMPNCL